MTTERKARELLSAYFEENGSPWAASLVRQGASFELSSSDALRVIARALKSAEPAKPELCSCGKPAEYMTTDGDWCCNKFSIKCQAQQPEAVARQPDGYAYRYRDAWGTDRTVIVFNDGRELNGSKPIEAVPYYFGTPPKPAEAEAQGELTEQQKADRDAVMYGTGFMLGGKHIPAQDVMIFQAPQQPEAQAVEWMREQARKMRMADAESATVSELGSYLSSYVRDTITAADLQPEAQETEQSIKADAYDMVAESLRNAGLLGPGGSVVDAVAGLVKQPEAQAGGSVAVVCAVCEELCERIENGYVPNGSKKELISLRSAALSRIYTTPPAKVPEGLELNLAVAEASIRKLEMLYPVTPVEATSMKAVIVGVRTLLAAAPDPA